MLAADAWAVLKKRTCQSGIIVKLNSMRAAITTNFSKAKETNATIGELCDHLAAVFESGVTPTQDEWFIILMLNSLDGMEYDWLCKNLLTQFTNLKITTPSKDIVKAINFTSYNHHQDASKELANAAKAAGSAFRNQN